MSKGQQVQLFGVGVGSPGKSLNVTAANRTNVYYDIQPAPGDKTQVAVFGTPGLEPYITMPDAGVPIDAICVATLGFVYCIQSGKLYHVNTISNSAVFLANIPIGLATGEYDFASSNTQIVIACGGQGLLCYDTVSMTLTECFFTPSGDKIYAESVTFQDGYFIASTASADGKFYISGLYDGTSWNDLDYAVAEFSADTLVKVLSKNSVLYLFGSQTYEVWQNIGDLNFPFQRITGASVEYGLISRESIAQTSDSVIGLFRNRTGDIMFLRIAGGQPSNITPPDLAYTIRESMAEFDDPSEILRTVGYTYSVPGHEIYQVTFCGRSYCYDTLSGIWSIMKSGSLERHLGKYCAFQSYYPQLSYPIVSSYRDGILYRLNVDYYKDDSETNIREIVGNHIFLPDRGTFRISSISLDMEQGSAPTDVDMRVRLSLSRDGGHTFEEEYEDSSTTGEYTRFFQFNRLGRGRDIVPKIRMTDPCKFVLIGAVADISPYGW